MAITASNILNHCEQLNSTKREAYYVFPNRGLPKYTLGERLDLIAPGINLIHNYAKTMASDNKVVENLDAEFFSTNQNMKTIQGIFAKVDWPQNFNPALDW